jgi:sulfite exporter TauE/SafE
MSCPLHPALGPAGAGAFLLLGLAGSLHCAGMCGPLAYALGDGGAGLKRLLPYHAARLAVYAGLGWAAAALGRPLQLALPGPSLLFLAALPLLAYALWPRDLSLPWLGSLLARSLGRLRSLPSGPRAVGLGLLTPLLPCGLLYAALAGSLAAPRPALGAAWMLSFAAGTLPLLALSQWGLARGAAVGGPWPLRLRRASAACAAFSLLLFTVLP